MMLSTSALTQFSFFVYSSYLSFFPIPGTKVRQNFETEKEKAKKIRNKELNFRMWFKYGLKAQKLLDQGVWGHDVLLMPGACGAYMRNLSFLKIAQILNDFQR